MGFFKIYICSLVANLTFTKADGSPGSVCDDLLSSLTYCENIVSKTNTDPAFDKDCSIVSSRIVDFPSCVNNQDYVCKVPTLLLAIF